MASSSSSLSASSSVSSSSAKKWRNSSKLNRSSGGTARAEKLTVHSPRAAAVHEPMPLPTATGALRALPELAESALGTVAAHAHAHAHAHPHRTAHGHVHAKGEALEHDENDSASEESVETVSYAKKKRRQAFSLLAALLFACVAVFALFFTLSMKLGLALLLLFIATILFLQTENYWWHNSSRIEAHFWSIQSMLAGTAILFIDSPIAFGNRHPRVAIGLILFCGLVVHLYNRLLDMRQMTPLLKSTWDGSVPLPYWQSAKLLDDDIKALAYRFTLLSRLARSRLIARERAVIDHIRKITNKDQLNYVLRHINLPRLLDVIKDHNHMRYVQTANLRTELMTLLCETYLDKLDLYTKAILLNALMKFGLRAHPQAQEWAVKLVLSAEGDDLRDLKSIIDNYSEYYSVHYLVYNAIVNDKLRKRVLDHLANHSAPAPIARHSPLSERPIKVISDIDDTLACSGGVFPSGVDYRFPKHTVYPGVLAFYRELDLGDPGHESEWLREQLGNIVFLSARPHIYKDNSEEQSYKKFRKLRELTHGLHSNPVLLVGDLKGISITWGNLEPVVIKKYGNFVDFAKLYPEYNFVLVGDNGQGDYSLALKCLQSHGTRIKAVFIHRVRPRKLTFGYDVDGKTVVEGQERIYFFATYIGAALLAWRCGLIQRRGVLRVIESARCEIVDSLGQMLEPSVWNDRVGELNEEIELVSEELNEDIPLIVRADEPVGFIQ